MYERILVAIDAHPTEENASAIRRTEQIGTLTGATVHVLHVARGHIIPEDITGGSARLGVWAAEDDPEDADRAAVQRLVDRLCAAASAQQDHQGRGHARASRSGRGDRPAGNP